MYTTDEWFDAAQQLRKLAEKRKSEGVEPWNNPVKIEATFKETEERIKADTNFSRDAQKTMATCSETFGKLCALLMDEFAVIDTEERVNDSCSNITELTLRFERLFVATISTVDTIIDGLPNTPEVQEAKEQISASEHVLAESFKKMLDELHRRHDLLFEMRYLIQM